MDYQTRAQSTPAIDEGLRQYMMSVYNYMASGLALTGLVAYMLFQATAVTSPTGDIVGLTSLGVTLYTGPMMWVVGGGLCETFLDHRIAMSFLVMGMASQRAITIDDGSPITTSFPSFENLMAQIGANFQELKQ